MLPRGIQRRLLAGDLEALPKFLRERVHYVTESAGEGQRAVDTPTTSMPTPFAEGQPTALTTHTRRPVVKFNMAEYYLFYLLYYPLWDFNAAPSASGSGVAANRPEALATPLKKATSLLSHTSEGIGGAAPIATPLPARTPVNYKRKPIFNTAYHAMLERYLSYLLPTADKVATATSRSHQSHHRPNETTPLRLRKHQPPHSGATSRAGDALLASAGGDTIISSRYGLSCE